MRLPVIRSLYHILALCCLPVSWEVSAGGVIFVRRPRGREYLLIRYPSGHFDYARGHVEPGESLLTAAKREITEETGITEMKMYHQKKFKTKFFYVAQGKERDRRQREGRGRWIFKEVYMFPVEVFQKNIQLSHEHTEFLWLPYEDAIKKVTYENARSILRKTEAWLQTLEQSSNSV